MGNVAMVRGQVYLARTHLMHPELVTQAYPLYVDDTLESQSQSGIQFSVHPSTRLYLGPNSRLAIHDSSDSGQAVLALDRGTLRIAIIPQEDPVFAVHILAGGSRVTMQEGEATVWVLEERNEPATPGPYVTTIQNVGVINHGTRGEVAFNGMDQTVVVRPGFLSVTAPNTPPVQAVAIDAAKPFATYIMQTTDLERHPNETTAITDPLKGPKFIEVSRAPTKHLHRRPSAASLRSPIAYFSNISTVSPDADSSTVDCSFLPNDCNP